MKKLTLDLDDLVVESFVTTPALEAGAGTVFGNHTDRGWTNCGATCGGPGNTCQAGYTCDTAHACGGGGSLGCGPSGHFTCLDPSCVCTQAGVSCEGPC